MVALASNMYHLRRGKFHEAPLIEYTWIISIPMWLIHLIFIWPAGIKSNRNWKITKNYLLMQNKFERRNNFFMLNLIWIGIARK